MYFSRKRRKVCAAVCTWQASCSDCTPDCRAHRLDRYDGTRPEFFSACAKPFRPASIETCCAHRVEMALAGAMRSRVGTSHPYRDEMTRPVPVPIARIAAAGMQTPRDGDARASVRRTFVPKRIDEREHALCCSKENIHEGKLRRGDCETQSPKQPERPKADLHRVAQHTRLSDAAPSARAARIYACCLTGFNLRTQLREDRGVLSFEPTAARGGARKDQLPNAMGTPPNHTHLTRRSVRCRKRREASRVSQQQRLSPAVPSLTP